MPTHICITTPPPAEDTARIPDGEWQRRQKLHRAELNPVLDPWLIRRSQQKKDPILDFLFEYYSFTPAKLLRWSPGLGRLLEGDDKASLPDIAELTRLSDGYRLDPNRFPKRRIKGLEWILALLKSIDRRRPSFGCFGMHEWAMVYRAESVRHNQFPLRLSRTQLNRFVESRPLTCTHYDAYRFFAPQARPLNRHCLTRDAMPDREQAGCLHTNMDLYKWCYKLDPWIPAELTRRAFLLAVKTRRLDMKASPYDLRALGVEPICIETEAGRLEYVTCQQEIYEKSRPVRKNLVEECERLLTTLDGK